MNGPYWYLREMGLLWPLYVLGVILTRSRWLLERYRLGHGWSWRCGPPLPIAEGGSHNDGGC